MFKWVTNEAYAAFCLATGYAKPVYWVGDKIPAGSGLIPVTLVSAVDADAYCIWTKTRLPTDEEAKELDDTRPPWIWEWTSTTEGTSRVLRGGSWFFSSRYLRASVRAGCVPAFRLELLGFRCARLP